MFVHFPEIKALIPSSTEFYVSTIYLRLTDTESFENYENINSPIGHMFKFL